MAVTVFSEGDICRYARWLSSTLLCCVSLFFLPQAIAEWHYEEENVMGTRVSLYFWQPDGEKAKQITQAVMDEMHRIDRTLSTYKDDSDLSAVNREAAKAAQKISPELFFLLDKSLYFGRISEGAFDITYASVGRYYDYREKKQPSPEQRDALLKAIDYHHVVLDKQNRSVRFTKPQVYVDLGGIAKGYAVDRAARILGELGVENASVSAGGDSRIVGDKRGRPFIIGIKNPRAGLSDNETLIRMPLVNTAISTSGDYERYFIDEQSGERVHHIINPKTGNSAKGVVSVTVLGEHGVDTDPLSTTVFVLGVERGLALINKYPEFDCVIIDSQGKAHYSNGLIDPEAQKRSVK